MASAFGIKSNKINRSYQGWDAEMVYVLPYSSVAAFLRSNYLDEYAASINMAVVSIADEPYMDGDLIDAATGMSATRKITVRFAVVYLNVPWPTAIPMPTYAAGTTLKLHATYGGQLEPLSPRAHHPTTGPIAGPNSQLSIYQTLNEFHVEWGRITDLGAADFHELIGAVNSDTFMGVAPGQLLCAGASLNPSFVLTPSAPCAWTALVTLKQKTILATGGPYGWNDWYNPATQQWETFTLTSGDPRYTSTSFAGMFV